MRERSKAQAGRPPSGPGSIRRALATAVGALLGTHSSTARASEVDSAILFYTEFDRVSAFEAVGTVHKEIGERKHLDLKVVVDILTGASPNGAQAADRVQTFTHPSGRGRYKVEPGDTPKDDVFQDNRGALHASVTAPIGRVSTFTLGSHGSVEYDYTSFGVNGAVTREFDRRNTRVSAGFSLSADRVDPEGGAPIPFARMAGPGPEQPRQEGTKNKTVTDLLLGITQVIDRTTVAQINWSFSRSRGYHTDPFKLITVVDGVDGANLGQPVAYVFEHRPDARDRQSLYGQVRHRLRRDVVDLSYRYFWDDWGIRSHTVDLHYRWKVGDNRFWEPHLRLYRQSAADFYTHSLIEGEATPGFATADYRLGGMTAYTVGLKFGKEISPTRTWNARIEYYLQTGDGSPDDAIGAQRLQDLFPNVGALIAQFSYSFDWW